MRYIAEALLGAGADARLTTNDRGALPLHYAASCGNVGAIDLLLSSSPDTINQRDRADLAALGWAGTVADGITVAHLIAARASVQGSVPGCSLLSQAIMEMSEGTVRAITENVGGVFTF